jgi:hypothetical protein
MSEEEAPPPPTPPAETLTPIDLRFRDEVFYPWEESCHALDHPWEANPVLRKNWSALLASNDRLDREIGYLALSRCARLNAEEKESVHSFWSEGKDFEHIAPAAALRLLFAGGSPESDLFDIYFSNLEPSTVSANPISKTLLSMLSRHPHLSALATDFASKIPTYYLGLAWGLNPLISQDLLVKLASDTGPSREWLKASALVNPALPFDIALEMASPEANLDYVCLMLRPGLTPEQWELVSARYFPDETFMFLLVEHPAAQGKAPPAIDWSNPTLETIQYFSHQTYLGAIWRWWGPLLTMPWLADQVSDIDEPGVLLSFMIFGAPREIFNDSPALDHALSRRYIQQHPSVMLQNYYDKTKGKEKPGEQAAPPAPG